MGFITIILLAIGLSGDTFAISITCGLAIKKFKFKRVFKISSYLAVFQALMPVIGWWIGHKMERIIKDYSHWIAFFLLLYLGGKMIWESYKKKPEHECFNPTKNSTLIGLSLATSIDALVVGLSFGLLGTPILFPVVIIFFVTFIAALAGLYIGTSLGDKFNIKVGVIGGLILIGIGTKILLQHLGYIP